MSTAIVGGRVVPVTGKPIDGGTVLIDAGKITAVGGPGVAMPPGADIVDASGKGCCPASSTRTLTSACTRRPRAGQAATPILGVAGRIGSLEPGKDADLVIWSGDPLDVMSRAERAYIDGRGLPL
jgi:imidazolonepropionase-like amidohydrolase